LKTLPVYDLIDRKWRKIETYPDADEGYPMPRKCHSLVQHTTKDYDNSEETCVYITGGNYHGGPLNDVWKLSLKTRRWMRFRMATLRTSLFFHDACITPDACMYIFGGITTNTMRTNNLYKMWVRIPKLSVIAWEALLHYFPKMHLAPKNFMLEKGVPMHFVKRVHP
jgi:Galactose oxidase, central domain